MQIVLRHVNNYRAQSHSIHWRIPLLLLKMVNNIIIQLFVILRSLLNEFQFLFTLYLFISMSIYLCWQC